MSNFDHQIKDLDPEPIALLDLDGTVADFDGELTRQMRLLQAPDEEPFVNVGNFEGPPHVEARKLLIKSQPGFWRNLPRLPLGFEILDLLRELRFTTHILSKTPRRPLAAHTEKAEWCEAHVPDLPVMLTKDKGLHYGKVLVDDWPPFAERWLMWRKRGFVVVPAQPWNDGFQHPNVFRYTGAPEERAALRLLLTKVRATAGE